MFIFGLRTEEVEDLRHHYNPRDYLGEGPAGEVVKLLKSGYFNISEPDIFGQPY